MRPSCARTRARNDCSSRQARARQRSSSPTRPGSRGVLLGRATPFLLVLALLLAGIALAPAPAHASGSLAADAGDSVLASSGETIALHGAAFGGVAPYAFAWSWAGDAARIGNATSADATFATAGLTPQDVVLTLTVTDANGAVAADTVRHRVENAPVLVRRNVSLTYGLPDELVGAEGDARIVSFLVPAGLTRLVATLDWDEGPVGGLYDLDFVLLDPAGNDVSGGQGVTGAKPEVIQIDAPAPGGWTARILPFLNGPTTARLTVQGVPAGSLPTVSANGPYVFGSLDAQQLLASASGGVAPYAFAWDLDGDGALDALGESVSSSLPVGEHVVRVRVTDAVGFEVSSTATVSIREADTILRLRCGNVPTTPFWAMEFTSTKGSCWIHGGHHTYFLGDQPRALRSVSGFLFTVEQQFSPPTEHDTSEPGTTPLHLQVSMDGIQWSELDHGAYAFASLETRQRVDLAAEGDGQPFRFLRIHEPRSAAQGLSGYLDHSELDVEADLLPALHFPPASNASLVLDCADGDHMEAFFDAHPCWFGGIDRYDAPSFWHTYPLPERSFPDRIRGEFTLLPWRLDDWMQGDALANATNVSAFVQTSVDGVTWKDVAVVPATFGEPATFDVETHGAARFVRLFPEYHARFDQTAEFAPNHHPKGYFVDSRLVVDGLPATP